jgi:Ser/Thr protein kinase RdoA (MazF antagonist)
MKRKDIVEICGREVLAQASRLFGTPHKDLKLFPDYEGSANLVYEYALDKKPYILRISFRSDRNAGLIQAELNFVKYLAGHGVLVSEAVPSQNGKFVETLVAAGIPFHVVSFVKGKGMRVPDNDYRYRDDAPLEEYFQNWGRVLGKMHARSKTYQPASAQIKRPDWFELHTPEDLIEARVPERLPLVRDQLQSLFEELRSLDRDRDSFGLIHGDFNDGNFTVDYTNGDITVFDFDDCCYSWFVYELASAWEGGVGRIMFEDLDRRKGFMDHYLEQVLEGYSQENAIGTERLSRLPLFLKLVQAEELLHFLQYIDTADAAMQARLNYLIKCIEDDIPYLGFFDSIYSPERPFSL